MTDDELEAWRVASGVKLAMLDRRDGDVNVILSGLDTTTLKAVIVELAASYWDAIRFSGVGVVRMRGAVSRDAMRQATMTIGKQEE